jgi:hypothetical protein
MILARFLILLLKDGLEGWESSIIRRGLIVKNNPALGYHYILILLS